MQRYFMEISYKGSNYHGWQIQPNAPTVQDKLETALSLLCRDKISVTGCGRTDTGVHATSFFLHFDHSEKLPDNLQDKLNRFLPKDIAVLDLFPVRQDVHARFDALSRTYRYYIHQRKDPFLSERSWFVPVKLDIDAMNQACNYLFDYEDFTSFSKLHTDTKTNNCRIMKARWEQDNHRLIFEIQADRFLRNMVRAIVGSLTDTGKGKYSPEHIKTIIEAKDRSEAGQSVPAQGLYLTDISYPSSIKAL
jgi:tRNA pseudouridine38-40 synthase